MKNNQIALKEFVINKQLTRAIADYTDTKALPHVVVAQRLKNQGKPETDLRFIPYVICKVENTNAYLGDRGFHPEELINSKGKLELDIDWYITQ